MRGLRTLGIGSTANRLRSGPHIFLCLKDSTILFTFFNITLLDSFSMASTLNRFEKSQEPP